MFKSTTYVGFVYPKDKIKINVSDILAAKPARNNSVIVPLLLYFIEFLVSVANISFVAVQEFDVLFSYFDWRKNLLLIYFIIACIYYIALYIILFLF